jgi:hypothetical protein
MSRGYIEMPNFVYSKIKMWFLPCLFILICAIIISYIVTINKNDSKEQIYEGLTIPGNISTSNVSSEKVKLLLPHLKVLLLSSYPSRKSVTSDWDKSYSNTWEDLSGNKNDFTWNKSPVLVQGKGFSTKGNTLTGPLTNILEFNDTHQLTIILKTEILEEDKLESENNDVDIGEVIANAKLSIQNKDNSMSINIPATIKESFEDLKNDIVSGNQTQDTLKNVIVNASKIKDTLDNHPNNGKKPKQKPAAFVLYGNQGKSIEVRIPSGVGNLEISVAGKPTTNIQKMPSTDDTNYAITYNTLNGRGHLTAYVNTVMVIDEDVDTIYMGEKNIVMNPTGDLNIGIKEVALLNRSLNNQEIGYFCKYGVVLRTILDNPTIFETRIINNEEQKCTIKCKTNTCVEQCVVDDHDYCPTVSKDSYGNYIVKGASYGNDRRVAREVYRINFPKCKEVPEILDEWYNRPKYVLEPTCPFIINSPYNPCKSTSCDNVNWSAPTPDAAGMNKKCRRKVDSYCDENSFLDPQCVCWQPQNRDLPECRAYISQYNCNKDRGCAPDDFPIEAHKDFDQYIKKDRIPCWSCSLDELPPQNSSVNMNK